MIYTYIQIILHSLLKMTLSATFSKVITHWIHKNTLYKQESTIDYGLG